MAGVIREKNQTKKEAPFTPLDTYLIRGSSLSGSSKSPLKPIMTIGLTNQSARHFVSINGDKKAQFKVTAREKLLTKQSGQLFA